MNNTIYLLKSNDIYLYTDINLSVIKLLKIIYFLLKKNLPFENIRIDCYLNNSADIYNTFKFNLDNYLIQDSYNNTIKLVGEYKYLQNNFISSIKNLYKNNDNYKKNKSDKIQKLLEEKKKHEELLKQMKDNIQNETKELDSNKKKKEENENKKKEFDAILNSYKLIKNDIDNNIINENDINPQFKISYNIFNTLDLNDINLYTKYYEKYRYYKNIEMINNYLEDKKMYFSINENIKNNEIYEKDISKEFELKYKIFNNLLNNNLINNDCNHHDNIKEEYNRYVEICSNINKYEPHNKNYTNKIIDYDENIKKIINQL